MDDPQVSVVMAVYDCEKYISMAIDSILKQTFNDFEFIIVSDGANVKTREIINSFNDKRIVFVEQDNKGLPLSLNKAIGLARGKYIARMDCDDVSKPFRLQKQFDYLEKNKGISILGGQAEIVDHKGKPVGYSDKPIEYKHVNCFIRYSCPVMHPTYFVRKGVYSALGGYRNITPGQDYDFLIRARKHGYLIENLPDRIISYRINNTGNTSGNIKKTILMNNLLKRIQRVGTDKTDDVFLKICSVSNSYISTDEYFQFIYDSRNKLVAKYKKSSGVSKMFFLVSIIVVCLFNIHIMRNTVIEYFGKKKCSKNG